MHAFLSSADFFSNQTFSKIRNTIKVSNSLDPDQAWNIVTSDLGPTCLQRLSVANTSRQRVNAIWNMLMTAKIVTMVFQRLMCTVAIFNLLIASFSQASLEIRRIQLIRFLYLSHLQTTKAQMGMCTHTVSPTSPRNILGKSPQSLRSYHPRHR